MNCAFGSLLLSLHANCVVGHIRPWSHCKSCTCTLNNKGFCFHIYIFILLQSFHFVVSSQCRCCCCCFLVFDIYFWSYCYWLLHASFKLHRFLHIKYRIMNEWHIAWFNTVYILETWQLHVNFWQCQFEWLQISFG